MRAVADLISSSLGEDQGLEIVEDELTTTLQVTASPSQHERIVELLDRLDSVPMDARRPLRAFPVRNRDVDEIATLVRDLIEAGALESTSGDATEQMSYLSRSQAVDGDATQAESSRGTEDEEQIQDRIKIAVDRPTSRLLAIGEPRDLDRIATLIAELDVEGTKRVEIRRLRPAVKSGDPIVFYETSPTCAVVARAIIRCVTMGSPTQLWRSVGRESGLTRQEFMAYFSDCTMGFAIAIRSVCVLREPVTLSMLRRAVPDFAPPQSYHYLRKERARDRRLAACLCA